jgi:hypothetical protein
VDRMKAERVGFAVTFAANPTSRRVFEKHGFEKWGEVCYQDFEFRGVRPFGSLPDEVTVLVKKLDIDISSDYDFGESLVDGPSRRVDIDQKVVQMYM